MTELDGRYYPLILDSIEQGIFTVDERTCITSFNKQAELITGFSANEAIGSRCADIFRSNLCDTICPLKHAIHTREPLRNRQVRIHTREGRSVPISVSTSPLVAPSGELLGGVEVFRDLTGVEDLRRRLDGQWRFDDIVSRSPQMQRVFKMLPLVADGTATVLVTGPSGCGKELVARAIHSHSRRGEKPFIAFNCAAVPETLIESELFGYVRGAFTDAHRDKPGRIAQAHGGTLFLDEVGDLPMAIQVKLLRFLQDRRYEPLGSNETVSADVRVIAATHRDLRRMVYEGRFREDLYYRIHIVEVPLPSLAARREDIPLLIRHFVARFRGTTGKPIEQMTQPALAACMRYPWPGNVRELENAIEHAFVLCERREIGIEHLPAHVFSPPVVASPGSLVDASPSLDELEREALMRALQRAGGNKSKAARELGIHRTTLLRKLKRLGMT